MRTVPVAPSAGRALALARAATRCACSASSCTRRHTQCTRSSRCCLPCPAPMPLSCRPGARAGARGPGFGPPCGGRDCCARTRAGRAPADEGRVGRDGSQGKVGVGWVAMWSRGAGWRWGEGGDRADQGGGAARARSAEGVVCGNGEQGGHGSERGGGASAASATVVGPPGPGWPAAGKGWAGRIHQFVQTHKQWEGRESPAGSLSTREVPTCAALVPSAWPFPPLPAGHLRPATGTGGRSRRRRRRARRHGGRRCSWPGPVGGACAGAASALSRGLLDAPRARTCRWGRHWRRRHSGGVGGWVGGRAPSRGAARLPAGTASAARGRRRLGGGAVQGCAGGARRACRASRGWRRRRGGQHARRGGAQASAGRVGASSRGA